MKSKQFIGPFTTGQAIDLGLSNVSYLKIGIEHPQSVPISEQNPTTVLSINNVAYAITEKDILEFENLNLSILSITVEEINNPYFIIDILYE